MVTGSMKEWNERKVRALEGKVVVNSDCSDFFGIRKVQQKAYRPEQFDG